MNILHLNASSQKNLSSSNKLSSFIVNEIVKSNVGAIIKTRDLTKENINIDEDFIKYRHLDFNTLDKSQKETLKLSQILIKELMDSDILVISTPIYNFNAPACLKAWSEQLSRVNITFKKENNKIIGLVENKKTYIAVSSLATTVGSEVDFLTPWLKCYLNFIGIKDITFFSINSNIDIEKVKHDIKKKINKE